MSNNPASNFQAAGSEFGGGAGGDGSSAPPGQGNTPFIPKPGDPLAFDPQPGDQPFIPQPGDQQVPGAPGGAADFASAGSEFGGGTYRPGPPGGPEDISSPGQGQYEVTTDFRASGSAFASGDKYYLINKSSGNSLAVYLGAETTHTAAPLWTWAHSQNDFRKFTIEYDSSSGGVAIRTTWTGYPLRYIGIGPNLRLEKHLCRLYKVKNTTDNYYISPDMKVDLYMSDPQPKNTVYGTPIMEAYDARNDRQVWQIKKV